MLNNVTHRLSFWRIYIFSGVQKRIFLKKQHWNHFKTPGYHHVSLLGKFKDSMWFSPERKHLTCTLRFLGFHWETTGELGFPSVNIREYKWKPHVSNFNITETAWKLTDSTGNFRFHQSSKLMHSNFQDNHVWKLQCYLLVSGKWHGNPKFQGKIWSFILEM